MVWKFLPVLPHNEFFLMKSDNGDACAVSELGFYILFIVIAVKFISFALQTTLGQFVGVQFWVSAQTKGMEYPLSL